MYEYEYSFKVENIDKYVNYCKNNDYKLIDMVKQTRIIYRNDNKTMARITINEYDNNTKMFLDFKEDNLTDDILKIRKETLPLEFNDIEIINSMLDFLEYKKDITLIRKRIIYEKENIKFEIDEYKSPEVYNVVAIEGNKEYVDKVYNELEEE